MIGVDTHRDTHSFAVVRAFDGAVLATSMLSADRTGYQAALAFAELQAPTRRVWALEGTGSWGAGLARALAEAGERVIEIDRPNRGSARSHAKSDELDAIRAARSALGREKHATPRQGATQGALRALLRTREGAVHARTQAVNELRALVATAPETLRERLRGQTTPVLLRRARSLRRSSKHPLDEHAMILAIKLTARRVEALISEADTLEREISTIVAEAAPQLWPSPASGRSAPRNCSSAGATPAASTQKQPSHTSPAPPRSPPPAASRPDTDSTAAATANSTARCTRSSSAGSSTTPAPPTTPPAPRSKARPAATPSAASNATSPATSTDYCNKQSR